MSIKFLVLGGGGNWFFGGGGKCRFYFYGREDFSESFSATRTRIVVKMHRFAQMTFCYAHRTAQVACFGPI